MLHIYERRKPDDGVVIVASLEGLRTLRAQLDAAIEAVEVILGRDVDLTVMAYSDMHDHLYPVRILAAERMPVVPADLGRPWRED